MLPFTSSICVSADDGSPTLHEKAVELAKKLQLFLCDKRTAETWRYRLQYSANGLALYRCPDAHLPEKLAPLRIDFVNGSTAYRLATNRTTRQPLARAVGIRPNFRPHVLDATGGLGGDAFVLASLGCQVTLCERSPVIAALLADALQRAGQDPATRAIVSPFLRMITMDARHYLAQLTEKPSTIYLDPMYPHQQKTALNKKEMRIIREIVGDDDDSPELLAAACCQAGNRVVVKRPAGAGWLADCQPTHAIHMKNSRFDVYLTAHL